MARIDDLLREADLIIEKKASKNTEVKPVNTTSEDEVTKLANILLNTDSETFGVNQNTKVEKVAHEENLTEKIAEALILAEVVCNLDKFNKIAEFEKQAQAAGYSQLEIDKFIVEKML